MEKILFEKFIETDSIRAVGNKLRHKKISGFVEVTVGVLAGHALSPSITIAESSILSVEEKFQGGTGINITPPSEEIVAVAVIERAKKSIEKVAKKLGTPPIDLQRLFTNIVGEYSSFYKELDVAIITSVFNEEDKRFKSRIYFVYTYNLKALKEGRREKRWCQAC